LDGVQALGNEGGPADKTNDVGVGTKEDKSTIEARGRNQQKNRDRKVRNKGRLDRTTLFKPAARCGVRNQETCAEIMVPMNLQQAAVNQNEWDTTAARPVGHINRAHKREWFTTGGDLKRFVDKNEGGGGGKTLGGQKAS